MRLYREIEELRNNRLSGTMNVLFAVAMIAGLSSCAFRRLKSDIRSAEKQMTMVVTVDMEDQITGRAKTLSASPSSRFSTLK
jgi:uncharacterized membrane protein YciS (DUF1049 family)